LTWEHPCVPVDSGNTYANSARKITAFWFLFSLRKSVFVSSRSLLLFLNEKLFLFQYKCCDEMRFSRCSSQEFAGFMVVVWLQLSEYVDITYWRVRENLWIFLIMWLLSSQDHTGHQELFLYVRNSLHSCIFLSFFPDILRSCDRKFVFRFWARARCPRSVVVNVIVAQWKRELPQKPNLCLLGAWKFPPKNLCTEQMSRLFAQKNPMARGCADSVWLIR